MSAIADTGYLVAYWSEDDQHHDWARSLNVHAPLITCEAVITEAAYLTGAPELFVQMIADGDLIVDFAIGDHSSDILRWLSKYDDLDPGYADACVVKLGELFPRRDILTTDATDFRTYRTLAGKPLRCIFPE